MVELSLLTSSTGFFNQEQSIFRGSKEYQTFPPSPGISKEIVKSGSLQVRPAKFDDQWKSSMGWIVKYNQPDKLVSTIKRPVLIDVKETHPESVLFSFGIAEQCTRQQNILKFLMSGSSEAGREGIDFSLLSNLMGLDTCRNYKNLQKTSLEGCLYEIEREKYQHSLLFPRTKLYSQTPVQEFIGNLTSFKTTAQQDGRVLFSVTEQIKDLHSVVEEFYPSKSSARLSNQSILVPYLKRKEASKAWTNIRYSSSKLETATVTVTPLKSPKEIKLKPSPKKRNHRRAGKERDLYRKSNFHACESLLSFILDKRHGNAAILSLKKSDPELPQVLTHFSAGIAGTGLAVLFSVVCKAAGGRVPFCASKLLNTGFGFGLVWLSWAVNKLRDTIVCVNKKTSKLRFDDKEIIRRVDQSVNEICLRAATVMLFAVLRFA
ncbi:hypothetical protein IFM89_000989 [Coptis chinensis]|uniref:Uncharacterized protein n=1 Tax=Coptis chinensis TaxID=261450 RepID=A0A835M951_9MAGN|nr:hypothetical protein IFM89_000989 [Coptis chinensis]